MSVNQRGQVVGYLNQIEMGQVTGIGVRGKNGLLLHSRYGSRLMLGGVVTTADLPRWRTPEIDEPGCPADCRICADVCPVGAILIEERRVRIMICLATPRVLRRCPNPGSGSWPGCGRRRPPGT
jgi:epoxyqueuosine reductase QueG